MPASFGLHLIIAALLVFGLPVIPVEPQKEQAIKVDLVSPPKPPEKAPEPAKKAESPPPAAEKPKPEKPQEAKAEQPKTTGDKDAKVDPLPTLKPVFRFGDKDAGPRKAVDGNGAEEGSTSPTAKPDADQQDVPAPEVQNADQQQGGSTASAAEAADRQNLAAPPLLTAPGAAGQATLPQPPEPKASKKTGADKISKAPKLQQAKRLFSRAATGDPVATTLMAEVPRGVRTARLCVTELREQLLHASPPYFPDILPSYRLETGTVLDKPRDAFRAFGQWYELGFRCEVDADATRVVSFAFRVGDPVPRSEWARRGLPTQ